MKQVKFVDIKPEGLEFYIPAKEEFYQMPLDDAKTLLATLVKLMWHDVYSLLDPVSKMKLNALYAQIMEEKG